MISTAECTVEILHFGFLWEFLGADSLPGEAEVDIAQKASEEAGGMEAKQEEEEEIPQDCKGADYPYWWPI